MNELPARRGWRGEAAGIPPARALVPTAAAVPALESASEGAEPFPLWPTTSTLTLHEEAPVPPAPGPSPSAPDPSRSVPSPSRSVLDRQAPSVVDREVEAAHAAGRTAVLDHLAGKAEQWPPPAMRAMRQPRDERRSAPPRRARRPKRTRPPRGPLAGLTAMLLIALLAGFFAWTSAEPFWLDMGHGVKGTAEVTACQGTGLLRRCRADFAAPGRETVDGARLMGLDGATGASVTAEMLPGGRVAYAGNPSGLRVRWAAGLGLIVLCGVMLAWLTGAWRFARLRERLTAWLLTAASPIALSAAIVLATR
ncbi:hypothetical protein AB0M46_29050 [Dactylosporangium sp. NPDC051485]|uniref:hypothetical protein n=1 Tax=Dactylosporangium sp. NPDC051485 TaxID=3154846 RepID=UPI0034265664